METWELKIAGKILIICIDSTRSRLEDLFEKSDMKMETWDPIKIGTKIDEF